MQLMFVSLFGGLGNIAGGVVNVPDSASVVGIVNGHYEKSLLRRSGVNSAAGLENGWTQVARKLQTVMGCATEVQARILAVISDLADEGEIDVTFADLKKHRKNPIYENDAAPPN
jgi:hypothetical protein